MIEACGHLSQLLGLPRSTGQIYGLLYLSVKPLSLDQMVELLGISKASASMGTRQLGTWGAVRQIWVPGDRRDYFVAVVELADLINRGYSNYLKPRFASSRQRIDSMTGLLEEEFRLGQLDSEEYEICHRRLKTLSRVQNKITTLAPLAERLL
jgi:DNA-binding transcriptional regulator GbsR (MarR family)